MTRDEKLEAIAQVLMTAAEKAKELSDTGTKNGYLSRETALAMQVEGIAHEFKALAKLRAQSDTETNSTAQPASETS